MRTTRATIRELKRKVGAGLRHDATDQQLQAAREAAIALLQRSITMKHDRLSLHRLADALKLGAAVDAHAWGHCTAIAISTEVACFAKLRTLHPSLQTLVRTKAGGPRRKSST